MSYHDEHRAWQQLADRVVARKERIFARVGVCYIAVKVCTGQFAVGYPAPGDAEGHQAAFRAFEQKYGATERYGLFLGVAVRQPF